MNKFLLLFSKALENSVVPQKVLGRDPETRMWGGNGFFRKDPRRERKPDRG